MKRLVPAVLLLALLASACGKADLANAPDPSDGYAIKVPSVLAGLQTRLSKSSVAKLKKESKGQSYARDIQVFELRDGKELRAALEVLRLSPDARIEDLDFRDKLVGLIGGTQTKPKNVGGIPVYEAKQNQQFVYTWFHDRFMQVLIVRANQTQQGQAIGVNVSQLLQAAIALKPTKIV